MAGTVGIAKSSVSRRFIRASREALEALMGRRFDEVDILAGWIDGIIVDDHHILAPSASTPGGRSTCWGLRRAPVRTRRWPRTCSRALSNAGSVRIGCGCSSSTARRALRSAIEELFGGQAKVQRCRIHKMRNVHRAATQADRRAGESRDACGLQARREGRDREPEVAGHLAQDRVRRRRGEPPRRAGRDLHRQSAEAHALADALPREHQRHRESERCGASSDPSCQSLPRRRDGAALDGDRIPGSGALVPQDPGPSPARVLGTALGRSVEEVDVKTRAA